MKQTDFSHADTYSQKLKLIENLLGGHGQKWVCSVFSQDSKIDRIRLMELSEFFAF